MESNQESMVTLTGSDQVVRELAHPATGAIEAEKVTITDNKEAGVYELWVDGQTAAGTSVQRSGDTGDNSRYCGVPQVPR